MSIEPWQFMWGLAVLIFFVCKLLTWQDAGRLLTYPLTRRDLGYWFAWPGLDARAFILNPWEEDDSIHPPDSEEWHLAANKTLLGFVFFYGVARRLPQEQTYLVGWVGMVSIVFMLHFGIFHLLSCFWRSRKVNAEPLMNWPVLSSGLSDFWGKRWNTAFRNLTHRFLFRPLLKRLGTRNISLAVLGSFLFSGLVHDLVISVPARGGYGGPTLYFLIQGIGLLMESRLRKKGLSGWKRRVYCMAFLLLPIGLLFHRPFVLNVVVPFMKAVGALSCS